MSDSQSHAQVSVSDDSGRVLTGVGVSSDTLQGVVDTRAPVEEVERPPSDAPTADAPTPTVEAPKQTRGQARFSELTKERDEAKARADAAEKRAQDIEARLNQPQPPAQPRQEPERPPVAPSQPHYTRPEPSEDEVGPDGKYKTYLELVRDHEAWAWEQRQQDINQRIQQGIDGHQQHRAYQSHVESTRAKGRAVYKDFDTVLSQGPGAGVMLGPSHEIGVQRCAYIYDLPNTEHIQYAILKDATLAHRLAQMSDFDFAVAVNKLAPATLAASPASTSASGSVTPPPPLQPVGSGSRTTTPSSAELAKRGGTDFDKSGYRETRAAERARFRRLS